MDITAAIEDSIAPEVTDLAFTWRHGDPGALPQGEQSHKIICSKLMVRGGAHGLN